MLNTTNIRKATAGPKEYRMTDGRGLYLLVTPAGGKLWRYKYRFQGAQKEMSYGKYPEVRLEAARERHAAARKLLSDGKDPMALRKAERVKRKVSDVSSFESIATMWLSHWRAGKSSRHVDSTLRRLEANVYPRIGSRSISAIEASELVKMVKAIEQGGASDIAKRALQTTGQIFRYGIAHGHCERNPAADIKPGDVLKSTRKINFARVDAAELPTLLRAIEVYRGHVVTRLAMKLMSLTFTRTNELIGAQWPEFNIEEQRWKIPPERMKMRTPHIVPLSTRP